MTDQELLKLALNKISSKSAEQEPKEDESAIEPTEVQGTYDKPEESKWKLLFKRG